MSLTKLPIQHSPDFGKCNGRRVVDWKELRSEADCPCGITERHTHCEGCGGLMTTGDWDAPPIAEFTMRIGRVDR